MPRSYTGVWERIVSWENLIGAYVDARKGKSKRPDVMQFHDGLEFNLCRIKENLLVDSWRPSPFSAFEKITEAKRRQIQAPIFADRVVHHAIVRVIEPLFDRKFIYDSYSCRRGKGTHAAADRLEFFSRRANREWARPYVLKCDISKFFPSIDHEILWDILARTLRESRVLNLLRFASIVPDNKTGKGLPIGALTSQLFANIYMNELDHFVKECLCFKLYLRYADDFVFIDSNKDRLKQVLSDVEWLVSSHLHLKLNPKTSIFPLAHGIDFCGYRIWPTHRLPRKRVVQAAKRRFRRMGRDFAKGAIEADKIRSVVASFLGYMKHCNGRRSANSAIARLKQ